MTRFLFIRHAATELMGKKLSGRLNGGPLTASGGAQAERLARRLAGENIHALYSGPQQRARETARALAEVFHLEIRLAPQLDEIDYGDWSGRAIAELEAAPRWRAYNSIRSCTRIPGGELMLEAQARVVGFVERLCERHSGEKIALVSHADVIRAALAYYLGAPIDLMLRLEFGPASLSVVRIDEHGPIVECVNTIAPGVEEEQGDVRVRR
jgi:probable phosphoglycerate mutase